MIDRSGILVRRLLREETAERLSEIASLRMAVFADWPYLYDGDYDYERRYLNRFMQDEASLFVGAFDGDELVGVSTAAPLTAHFDEFAAPLVEHGIDPATVYYLSESVLLGDYRGLGIGRSFFSEREAFGARLGYRRFCFADVMREPSDERRPADYRPLAPFWERVGYAPLDGAVAHFDWREHGAEEETSHPMRIWFKTDEGAGSAS